MSQAPPASNVGGRILSASQASRFAAAVLVNNHEGKFRIDVEDPAIIARALRALGCKATQDLFRTTVLRITPPAEATAPAGADVGPHSPRNLGHLLCF